MDEVPVAPHPYQQMAVSVLLISAIVVRVNWHLTCFIYLFIVVDFVIH